MRKSLYGFARPLLFIIVLISVFTVESLSQKVFATRSGAKYHTSSCRYSKTATLELTVSEANKKGLTACSVCKPDTKTSDKEVKEDSEKMGVISAPAKVSSSSYSSSPTKYSKSGSSVQCSGRTKKGARCSRMTKSSNGYCYQHGG